MLGFILGFPFRGIFLHNLLFGFCVRLSAHKISFLLPRLPLIWRNNKAIPTIYSSVREYSKQRDSKAIPTNMNVSIFHQQAHQQ